ncbi:hypothetical protein PGT21_036150 [Puccinia graminis f. sp. tritici]|uniref:Uncharacterized protein n=1 Tax=Puccinia graminis f. sp. tritici TaxID=56615 RepID=A0A5B0Q086_PUCGR|nr:hypothetical protein PGT21_036150 [Puccinia graminis f. sp. tritici]KAA1126246.1 hypothetical protein PGTUg99_019627 [Puccinia graminis f. sp. tritici]
MRTCTGRPGYLKHQHPGGGSTRPSGVLQGTPSGLIAGALEPAPTTHLLRRQPFTSSTSYIIGKMGTNKTQSAGSDRSTSILMVQLLFQQASFYFGEATYKRNLVGKSLIRNKKCFLHIEAFYDPLPDQVIWQNIN